MLSYPTSLIWAAGFAAAHWSISASTASGDGRPTNGSFQGRDPKRGQDVGIAGLILGAPVALAILLDAGVEQM
jgi:hypothetical protein